MGVCASFLVSFKTIHKYLECTGKITGFTEAKIPLRNRAIVLIKSSLSWAESPIMRIFMRIQ